MLCVLYIHFLIRYSLNWHMVRVKDWVLMPISPPSSLSVRLNTYRFFLLRLSGIDGTNKTFWDKRGIWSWQRIYNEVGLMVAPTDYIKYRIGEKWWRFTASERVQRVKRNLPWPHYCLLILLKIRKYRGNRKQANINTLSLTNIYRIHHYWVWHTFKTSFKMYNPRWNSK